MKWYKTAALSFVILFMFSCWGFYIPNDEEIEFEVICNIWPNLGTPGTEFSFVVNAIKIRKDSITHLVRHKFRWDFDADGVFDTDWSEELSKTYIYENAGDNNVIIEVETPGQDIYKDTCIAQVRPLTKLHENISGHDIGSVDWSIDSSNKIAYDSPVENLESAIWVIDYPGGEPQQISSSPAYFPEWSPDGKYILFRRNSEFWIVDVETKNEQLILNQAGIISFIPHWSHSGRELIYTTLNGIEKYRFSSGGITIFPGDITYNLATWSMDDQQVATASRNNEMSAIEIFDLEEGKISASYVLGFSYKGGKLDWSLNNKHLSIGFAGTRSLVHIIDLKTNERKQVAINGLEDTWYASWSPDSKMLVFEGRTPGENTTIWGVEIPENF
jgi:hypothetical protein